ncbi:granzyme E-like [Acomys russatus]|uniref:granzyme E-like n=1 Tax=Acomys russatus TaxID=60746 RepID=UPI0021E28F61|nr:granzyme E-like [Acomys russatus]
MAPALILLAFLLSLGAQAEEIIGGREARPHSRPYMAFIESEDIDGNRSCCSGFLIRYNFVLTAAHCRGRSVTVTLGAHNITAQEQTQQIIRVTRAIPHPDYNPKEDSNDIMLLKLERRARRTRAVRLIKLPTHNVHVTTGDVCHVAGWGSKSFKSFSITDLLQEAELVIAKDEECKKCFRHYSNTTQICAGDPKKEQLAFKGDSGGPLVCDNRALGVVSYAKSKKISPVVFTKVAHFLPWINRNTNLS